MIHRRPWRSVRATLRSVIPLLGVLAWGGTVPALLGGGSAGAQMPPAAPTLVSRVDCRGLEGPCDYRYALVNPATVAEPAKRLVLFEAGPAEDRSSNGWHGMREGESWRWEDTSGVSAGWTQGGFLLHAEGLPKVALAQVETGSVAQSVPALVPGPPPEELGDAAGLIGTLRADLGSLAAAGWIAAGPGRGILDGRLRTVIELLERGQRTEATRRIRALVDEVGRLSPPAYVPAGRSPGGARPLLGGATPVAPEVRDLFVATLRLALARLGVLR